MMADTNDPEILSSTPFVAKINNTVIVFHAFNTTFREFEGTPEEAKEHIISFVESSRVIENSEIGL